jgi:hypothetical protein
LETVLEHADDGEGPSIDNDPLPAQRARLAHVLGPKALRNDGRELRGGEVSLSEDAPEKRSDLQGGQVAVRDQKRPCLLGPATPLEAHRQTSLAVDAGKCLCVAPYRFEFEGGDVAAAVAGSRHHDPAHAITIGHGEGSQQQRVDGTERNRVYAKTERQRQHRECRKAGSVDERSNGVPKIQSKRVHSRRRRIPDYKVRRMQ